MRLRLISKLTIATSLVLIIGMALFAYLTITQMERLFLEHAVADADKLSDTIIRTTHYQMLENDTLRVYQMISEAGDQKGIDRIRIINKSGRILFSTRDAEVGLFLNKNRETCSFCHSSTQPLESASSMNSSRIFSSEEGRQVLGMAKAIYNEESCYTAECHYHPKSLRILGILDVVMSLDTMQAQTSAYRTKIIALTLSLLLFIGISIIFCTMRMVNRPVSMLLQHTKSLAAGKLDANVEITSADELGELAHSFNEMTEKLKKAREELEEWGKNLEIKVEERTRRIKEIQAQLVRSEKLASLGELVAGIAHEINNPLTGILLFSSLLSKNTRLAPELKGELETITNEARRCANIVKGLLDFSRESTPQKKPASLNGIMEATLALVINQSSFHNIPVTRDYAAGLPEVMVDPNQIEQVLINILLNANHAMPNGGELIITTDLDPAERMVFVSIRDTGCGIPEENLKRIFDPFFTTKENRGTGLGLSVSYGIIESHGGKIEVESEVGVGTTFIIKLPLANGG